MSDIPNNSDEPLMEPCWVCIELDDDWTDKVIVSTPSLAGGQCEKHKDYDGVEEITDPIMIEHVHRHMKGSSN